MDPQEEINQVPAKPVYGKPGLPVIPESIKSQTPKLSGKCPGKAFLLMFILAPVISFVLGVIAHYLGIAVGFVGAWVALIPTLLTSVCGFVNWFLVLFGIAIVFMVYIGYPLLIGYLDGSLVVTGLGKNGKCRNAVIAGFAGLINGVTLYIGHSLMAWIVSKALHPLTFTTIRLESVFNTTIEGTPFWIYLMIGVEFILVLVGGFLGANNEIKTLTFCEKHNVWYGKWKQASFPVTIKEELAQAVLEMNPDYIEHTEKILKDTYPHILLQYRCCPGGADCDMELKANVLWQEQTVDKKGKTTISNQVETWFDVLLPTSFVQVLADKLGLEEVNTKKKSK
jgi:hypothetical protein